MQERWAVAPASVDSEAAAPEAAVWEVAPAPPEHFRTDFSVAAAESVVSVVAVAAVADPGAQDSAARNSRAGAA